MSELEIAKEISANIEKYFNNETTLKKDYDHLNSIIKQLSITIEEYIRDSQIILEEWYGAKTNSDRSPNKNLAFLKPELLTEGGCFYY